ncbi:MAG: hypothetical protein KH897_07770 [Bacteroides sp.]|uniref:hypothetical protein n=1 Tax=Bacteroides sp. TaxID=29523 RepID=UPI0025C5F1FB|nr:hypothetical protein [Bacteroides sp.]MBS6238256.1 hypothetical protein [Bacteroides sp.]
MDTFIFKYTKTLARIILTGNRLGRVTGNETVNVFITLVICLGSQLVFIAAVPVYIHAKLYHPLPKSIIYLIIAICAIISFCIVGIIYEKGVIKHLIEEARALSDEEHRIRRKSLMLRFIFAYALFPGYCMLATVLFDILLKYCTNSH